MHLFFLILKSAAALLGLWAAFFVVVMSCFIAILWVHRRLGGGQEPKHRRRER